MAQNHQRCSPLKALADVAEGNIFATQALEEAEEILQRRSKCATLSVSKEHRRKRSNLSKFQLTSGDLAKQLEK
jgi:hypothetical protein